MSHTKGPWTLDDTGIGIVANINNEVIPIAICPPLNKKSIDVDANAQLISAAPEMLALVETLALVTVNGVNPNDFASLRKECWKVIKKARGE